MTAAEHQQQLVADNRPRSAPNKCPDNPNSEGYANPNGCVAFSAAGHVLENGIPGRI
jgi:hypothetical protein